MAREARLSNRVAPSRLVPSQKIGQQHNYLENKIASPFKARCIVSKGAAPLQLGDEFEVSGMALEEECEEEMFVNTEWQGEPIIVLLTHLEGIGVDEKTREAIEDWHYWVGRGYEFSSQAEDW